MPFESQSAERRIGTLPPRGILFGYRRFVAKHELSPSHRGLALALAAGRYCPGPSARSVGDSSTRWVKVRRHGQRHGTAPTTDSSSKAEPTSCETRRSRSEPGEASLSGPTASGPGPARGMRRSAGANGRRRGGAPATQRHRPVLRDSSPGSCGHAGLVPRAARCSGRVRAHGERRPPNVARLARRIHARPRSIRSTHRARRRRRDDRDRREGLRDGRRLQGRISSGGQGRA